MIGSYMPARIVGYALHGLPENSDVPWHRIINRKGEISLPSSGKSYDSLQKILLEREGICFDKNDRINLKKYLWHPESE
jgi:methylated-DNA-protein-cysteine methyltransferase-like protein